ncbi:helix-turn-helix domain-containing protein [Streptomyces sp. NPDC090306]|uniref:helix-turn-helix domain-containing protein n=1 Tax=Streptomyces sp. NPDC090306 TaxID=3365961 RepID=UPI00380A5B87
MTLDHLGKLTGYSAAQVSRYERGKSPLTDMRVLGRFARALDIPPQDLGLAPGPATGEESAGPNVAPVRVTREPEPAGIAALGLDFPRAPAEAIGLAATYWRTVDRRHFLGGGFAAAAYHTPVTRWLTQPADEPVAHRGGGRRVGRGDLTDLWQAADDARAADSRFGGGDWRTSSVVQCLRLRAAPLLAGSYTEAVGTELLTATAELSRVAGWAAVDVGHHDQAQRHLVQALRLARAAGDREVGAYVLTTMALHTLLRGHPQEGADMAEAAYERAKRVAAPRVLAFAKLIEARAHARTGDSEATGRALARSEALLDSVESGRDPQWLAYFTHARLSADATEIHRDLRQPGAALAWNGQASAMPADQFSRSVGMRLAILATVRLQHGDLDQSLSDGTRALQILRTVSSPRASSYVRQLLAALKSRGADPRVADFRQRALLEINAV